MTDQHPPSEEPQPPREPRQSTGRASQPGPGATRGFSRRRLLGAAGIGAAGIAVGAAAVAVADDDTDKTEPVSDRGTVYPFYDEHQAGIITPVQDRLHFASFDVITDSRDELIALLQDWTAAAARMTQGEGAGPDGPTSGPYNAPPDDTGEAIGLPPSGLTITFGFGPSLFRDAAGKDRFGIADRQPDALRQLPHFPADNLDPAKSDGDICVQACADDPQVAVHAVRNLARIAFGRASIRWSQLGFGRTSTTSTSQSTARNLFGFKDGTANLKAEEPDLLAKHVWTVADTNDAADWLTGGSYLVVRRINMTIEVWDRQSLSEQENIIGRTKAEGAPLSGGDEFTKPDFTIKGSEDEPLIPMDSHVRMVHPSNNAGAQMLRRGYNFVDGNNSIGRLDAGLFFLAFVTDPRTHFTPIQTKIGLGDGMSEYLQHTGSALFAIPPGISDGDYVGQALFEA